MPIDSKVTDPSEPMPTHVAVDEPALPKVIILNSAYAWFTKATKTNASSFVERGAGAEITDAAEIEYLVSIDADFTAA